MQTTGENVVEKPRLPPTHRVKPQFNKAASDMVSYEDLLIAQYLDDLRRTKSELRKEREVPVSPYLQRLPHSGTMTTHSKYSKRRPASATVPSRAKSTGKPKIDAKFIADANLWDPETPRSDTNGANKRPASAPIKRTRPLSGASSQYSYRGRLFRPSSGRRTKSLYKQRPLTIRVTAFKNGSREVFVRTSAPNIKMLLEFVTDKLGLPFAARRIFLEDGIEVFEERDIPPYAEIYISMGEAYKDPHAPTKRNLILRNGAVWTLSGIILPDEGKKKKTKTKLSKRMRALTEKKKVRIVVYRNGKSTEPNEVVADLNNLEEFLIACTSRLDLTSHARLLYDWEGREITDLSETPVLDDCLQPGGTPILGPLWVSTGEGFSPSGTSEFVKNIKQIVKKKLEKVTQYKKEIDSALNDERDKITISAILSMNANELYDALDKADQDIDQLSDTLKRLKSRLSQLKEEHEKEEEMGAKYKMNHIQEISADNRLVGTRGLKLKVFENGQTDSEHIFYFNLREALKGIGHEKEPLMQRLLDELSCSRWSASGTNPKLNAVAQKMYDKDGHKIDNVLSLEYDQEIWISYGENFICPLTYCVEVFFDKASKVELEGADHVFREPMMQEELQDQEEHNKWEATKGFPATHESSAAIQLNYDPEKVSWLLEFAEIDAKGDFLLSKKQHDLVLYPDLIISEKFKRKHDEQDRAPSDQALRKMKDSQIWRISDLRDDSPENPCKYISSKYMPQLCLGVSETRVEGTLFENGTKVEGFIVTLQKKMMQTPNQMWTFTPEGTICSVAYPEMLLTYLGNKHGDEESYMNNKPQGTLSGVRVYLLVAELLPKKVASFQRFALKQEKFENLGQWKFTDATNTEWNKQALSWPVKEDGSQNEKYDWPMEGFLIPHAPPLRKPGKKSGLSGMTPIRLMAVRNGERDIENAIPIVGPNLTNMMKDAAKKEKDKSRKSRNRRSKDNEATHGDSVDVDMNLHCRDLTVRELELIMFLDHCTSLLDLPFAGRRLFDEKGNEHFTLQSLKRDQVVFVSCGEQWSDPKLTKAEQERRFLLSQLGNDVAKIRQFCSLRHPESYVLETEGALVANSKIIVNKLWSQEEEEEVRANDEAVSVNQSMGDRGDGEDENTALTAHDRAHVKSDKRLNSLKWPWERLVNVNGSFDDNPEAQKYTDKEMYEKFKPRTIQKIPRDTLQRFVYEDGYIACAANRQLVLGVNEQEGRVNEVFLLKRRSDDINQIWVMKENGEICSKYNQRLVMTVSMPNLEETGMDNEGRPLTFVGCLVTLQGRRTNKFGKAHQRWRYDAETGFIHAFDTDLNDKEIMAANKADVCTYSIAGSVKIDQPGYLVEIPQNTLKDKKSVIEIKVCLSCARAMRGRYRLQRLPPSVLFSCAMGEAKKLKLRQIGSFRVLNGKVDLSTHEAHITLEHWEETLASLRDETSIRTIAKQISAARTVRTVKLLAYKNGEGRMRPGQIICGSSVQGILNQCMHQLGLANAARRLYTEDGVLMLEIDDLVEWAVENYKNALADKVEKMLMQENGQLFDVKEEDEDDLDRLQQDAAIENQAALQQALKNAEAFEDERGDGERGEGEEEEEEGEEENTEEGKTELDDKEAKKVARQRELLLSQVQLPPLDQILRFPIEVWVSSGKKFVAPEVVESKDINRKKKRIFRSQVALELEIEKHVLRQMKGRRLDELRPGEYKSTVSSKQPVVIEGNWQEPTVEEQIKHDKLHKLQTHLGEIRANQREGLLGNSSTKLSRRLYQQPNMKRVMVYPNGESIERAIYIWGESMDELLETATKKLSLWKQAKMFYTVEGKLIESFDDIERDQLLCVSTGKSFKRHRIQHVDVEIKANWSRARRRYGPKATEFTVSSKFNPKVDVDPFGPPELALPLEEDIQTERPSPSTPQI